MCFGLKMKRRKKKSDFLFVRVCEAGCEEGEGGREEGGGKPIDVLVSYFVIVLHVAATRLLSQETAIFLLLNW